LSPYAIVGIAALSVVVAGWLIVSFTAPSPRRAVIEWLSATALYLALCALFAHLCHRAWTQDSTFALVAFGFLLVVFVSGGIVSLTNALLSLRGSAREQQSATN
jgi:hypothetical protein